jgi:NAD(P)-dependent dehydrogenase (short-subunit alcohol dehydrogenase family)
MPILDRFSLKGKISLVTAGAGPLFGSSLSEALAEAGAKVITASRSLERNEEFAAGLRDKGYDAVGMAFELGNEKSAKKLHDDLIARFGRLDVLVNSALMRDTYGGKYEDQTFEQWDRCGKGDFAGLLHMCQLFIPDMVRQGKGSIINISSIYGAVSNDPSLYEGTTMTQPPGYTFVKAGMVNFTRYLACYYGKQGVRANCISPGGYYNDQPGPFVENYNKRCPVGRMLDNEDIKGAAVFLASDASEYITGHNLLVDGGWTAL